MGFLIVGECLHRRGASDGGALAVALAIHLEDGGVVDQSVDGGDSHGRVGKNLIPS